MANGFVKIRTSQYTFGRGNKWEKTSDGKDVLISIEKIAAIYFNDQVFASITLSGGTSEDVIDISFQEYYDNLAPYLNIIS